MQLFKKEQTSPIAASITKAIFSDQANQKSPEELLLEDLRHYHKREELYPVWRVAQLVRSIGFELFVIGEGSSQLKQKFGMRGFPPSVAHRPTQAIVLDSWQISKLAVDISRVRVCAATAAVTLHELGHLLDNAPGTQIQREQKAWAMARSLLHTHQFYGVCSEAEFDCVSKECLKSYCVHR